MAAAALIAAAAPVALPIALEAHEPPEARGLRRDDVKLLISDLERDSIEHARFRDIGTWLDAGDVLVVNTSATINAALDVETDGGERLVVHLSTRLPGGLWAVELRAPAPIASQPYRNARAGTRLRLPSDAQVTLLAPYPFSGDLAQRSRLWAAAIEWNGPWLQFLYDHARPIRYAYVERQWPLGAYQTVFATEPGSAEMPSAARPFTAELVTSLVSRGVQIAPLLLHTGVASQEDHEPPYEEYYRVPHTTADVINAANASGYRVIAVGTTVVRALETVTDERGVTHPGEGWTSLVISPARPLRSVRSIITGLHEPRATHLMMLEQVIAASVSSINDSRPHYDLRKPLEPAYAEARAIGYLWHEFGDSHLILGHKD